jgi:23S rRNA (adenine2030-N6)-methyltransferase
MLSYQHAYHAGNHADVLKHVVLGAVLAAMQHKEAPLFALDAFAGRGSYDLDSPEALKNRESDTGIGRIWPHRNESMPEAVAHWLAAVGELAGNGGYSPYPGSTALLQYWRRRQDRLSACEMHPQEFEALRLAFAGKPGLYLHKRDAFEALGALLPPKEKRGLVLLDPSYEDKSEYRCIARALAATWPHFRAGVWLIWYPLLPAGRHKELFRELEKSGMRKILRTELDGRGAFCIGASPMQMQGSGMLIVNPPWQVDAAIRESLIWLKATLCPAGRSCCDWLVPE